MGHRIDFQNNWFIEPQLELTWLYSQQNSFTTDNGIHITFEADKNLDLRAGLVLSKTFDIHNDRLQTYGKVDWNNPLSSSHKVSIDGNRFSLPRESNAWLVGGGVQYVRQNIQYHAEIEAGVGNPDVKQKWGLNLGVR